MPWFKVDDTAHSHPKLLKAGNAAVGLWLRAGAYAAQHLTEGIVPGVVVELYGTAPQARKLVAAGLWHEHGHTCPHPKCRQPAPGDYAMHDYLTYNPTRANVERDRQAAAARQQRARDRAAEQRATGEKREESSSKTPRFVDEKSRENLESPSNHIEFPDLFAGQGASSQRDASTPSRSPRPDPSPTTPYGSSNPPTPRDRPGRPGPAEQLLAQWWTTYGRTTAQSRTAIGRAIAEALANGLDRDQLAAALNRLGQSRKPITGGTLQFALADVRRPAAAGAAVIPLAAAGRGRVAHAADLFAAALANNPQEHAQ